MTFPDNVSALLPPGHPWGQHILYLPQVDSTNTYAKALARRGAVHGTAVIAGQQSGGRGRMGRSFSSPAGLGLYFSLILRPHCPPQQLMHLTCAAGLAAATAVERACGISPGIKWINDLIVDGKKLGGILTELAIDPATKLVDYAIIGIGINCLQQREDFPAPLRDMATSLALCGAKIDIAEMAAQLIRALSALDECLLQDKAALMARFSEKCITVGKQVSLIRGDQVCHATALGIDPDGALLVRYADGRCEAVACGEVSVRGLYGYL